MITKQHDLSEYLPLRCAVCGLPLGKDEGVFIKGMLVCAYSDCIARAKEKIQREDKASATPRLEAKKP